MNKNIAKVVFGLPIEEPFDYLIPKRIKNIEVGCRVLVPFREKKLIGYVVGFRDHSVFKNLRPILQLIDKKALLDEEFFNLAKEIYSYYFCSLGEAIETILPPLLRKGRKINADFPLKR